MVKLISLLRDEGMPQLGRRELPVSIDENMAMVMKLPELNLNRPIVKPKSSEMETFLEKCDLLTEDEMSKALSISGKEILEVMSSGVPCVGCRRSAERLYRELSVSKNDALYPVLCGPNKLTLAPEVVKSRPVLFVLFKNYGNLLNNVVDSISSKSRQTRRCPLHSLDAHRVRPAGLQWRYLWDNMAQDCKEELTLVEADTLYDTVEAYLQKHRFCPECRLKVLRAYSLLVGEIEPSEEKNYKPTLYSGLKCCPAEKHVHVRCDTELISLLLARAEPELIGNSQRERHAKTMEVAQEEIVTCVGLCLLERMQRLAQRVREEEQTADLLQCATMQAIRQSFELAVESKRGVSQLELLCQELSRQEEAQRQRKEMKRLRRKKRRGCKKENNASDQQKEEDVCLCDFSEIKCCRSNCKPAWSNVDVGSISKHSVVKETDPVAKGKILDCPRQQHDSGYNSTNSSSFSTPEGSDVACTEGLCNHHSASPVQCRPTPSPVPELMVGDECLCSVDFQLKPEASTNILSLEQMLQEWHMNFDDENDNGDFFIPLEEVEAFRNRQPHYNEQRQQLRNDLRLKFDQLCSRVSSKFI